MLLPLVSGSCHRLWRIQPLKWDTANVQLKKTFAELNRKGVKEKPFHCLNINEFSWKDFFFYLQESFRITPLTVAWVMLMIYLTTAQNKQIINKGFFRIQTNLQTALNFVQLTFRFASTNFDSSCFCCFNLIVEHQLCIETLPTSTISFSNLDILLS